MNVCTFGFGYDSIDIVFKVVCIRKIRVAVYSIRENQNLWRELELNDSSYQRHVRSSFDLCLHGYLIGVAKDGMMCFGLTTELLTSKFQLLVSQSIEAHLRTLMKFRNSVAYCQSYRGKVSLWTLDDDVCFHDDNVNTL